MSEKKNLSGFQRPGVFTLRGEDFDCDAIRGDDLVKGDFIMFPSMGKSFPKEDLRFFLISKAKKKRSGEVRLVVREELGDQTLGKRKKILVSSDAVFMGWKNEDDIEQWVKDSPFEMPHMKKMY